MHHHFFGIWIASTTFFLTDFWTSRIVQVAKHVGLRLPALRLRHAPQNVLTAGRILESVIVPQLLAHFRTLCRIPLTTTGIHRPGLPSRIGRATHTFAVFRTTLPI